MTYSWTYDTSVTIDGTTVSSALLSYSLSGNQTSAVVSGTLVFSKRALEAFVTAVTGMLVRIRRSYIVTEDEVTTVESTTIFRGIVASSTTEGKRTTVQVQDKLRGLLVNEVNKIFGTPEQPVDIGEIASEIFRTGGINTHYLTGTAAIQPTGIVTKGMTFAHTNAFEALKQLAESVDHQFYYDPRDDHGHFEPKGTRTTDTQAYVKGDFTGRPKWEMNTSDMCNKVGITTAMMTGTDSKDHTQTPVVDMSTGAYITITLDREAEHVVVYDTNAYRWLKRSVEITDSGPVRSMTEDFSYRVRDDGKTDVYIFQNTDTGTDAYYDYANNTRFVATFRYRKAYTYYYSDAESIATYGEITKTISRPDLTIGDNIAAVGTAYLAVHANPTDAVTVDLVQDPRKFCFLGGTVSIDDTVNGRSESDMTVISFTLNYPSKKDQFTFGQHQRVLADYTSELEHRIQQIEGNFSNTDFTQQQYIPIGGFVEEPDPDVTWTVTPSSATVLASATTTTNSLGNPMMWKTGYASGRHWVFWGDGTNDVYSHSINGVTDWAAKTTLNAGSGNDLSMDFSSNGFQFVRGYDVADLRYRRAVLNTNGTITLNSEVSADAGGSVNRIHHFSWDTDMNAVYSYMRDGSVYVNRMLKPSTGYTGTWVTDSTGTSGSDHTMTFPSTATTITVTLSGTTYTATRVSNNTVVSSGTNAATVIQAALDGLTANRTTKEKVLVQASATIGTMLAMPNYTVLECADGVVLTGGASNRIVGKTSAGSYIELVGGEYVCGSSTASQTVAPIYFVAPTNLIVRDLSVRDCMYDNIVITNGNYCTFYNVESYHSWPLDPMDIADNGWHGLIFQTTDGGNATHNIVQKCYFHENGHGGCYFYTEPGWDSDINYNEMRANRCVHCGTSGLSISQRSSAGQGHYNVIEYNYLEDCGLDNDHPFINIGYSSCYPATTTHNIVRYNTIIDSGMSGPDSPTQYGADQGIINQGSYTEIYGNDIKGCTGPITLLCGSYLNVHDNYLHEMVDEGSSALYNSAIVVISAVENSTIEDNVCYDVNNVLCYYTGSCGDGPGSNTIQNNTLVETPYTEFVGGYLYGSSGGGAAFPMAVVADADMQSHIARLSGSKFMVFYGEAGATVKARLFDGTVLNSEEVCSTGNLASATAICTAHDNSDEVWMVYTKDAGESDYRIMFCHRSAAGVWDAEQDVVGETVYSTSVGWIALGYDAKLYVVWFNYPDTDHIYYRPITKAGVMGDTVDAYTDADGIASINRANLTPVARIVTADPAVGVLDFAYLAGSTPYTLKLFKLTFSDGAAPVDDDEEPATTGSSPVGENYQYICYSDGRAGQKDATPVDRGSAAQGIQWCIDNCPDGGNILLSPGTYSIGGQITLKNNNVYGSVSYSTQTVWNGTTLGFVTAANTPVSTSRLLATWNDSSGGSGTGAQYIFRRDSAYTQAITVGYLELDGGMNYASNNSRAVYGGIGVYRSRNTTIDHCYIHNFCKAGVYIADSVTPTGSTYNAIITNCEIANIGMMWTSGSVRWWGNGVAAGGGGYTTGGSRHFINNCYIHDCTMHAIDYEPGKNSTAQNTYLECNVMYTDTGSNSKAPWTVGYLAWSGKSSTGNTLFHCYVESSTGWTVVYNGATTTGNSATYNDCHYHSGGAGFVASGDASLDDQTLANNTGTAI